MNTEHSLGCSNRCRDIIILKLLGCRPPPSWISLDLKFVTGQTVTRAELRHRAKFRQNQSNRGRDMAIFQDGGLRRLGFLKFQIFNGRDGQEGRTTSTCQILSKLHEPRLRYNNFSIFPRWRLSAILDL